MSRLGGMLKKLVQLSDILDGGLGLIHLPLGDFHIFSRKKITLFSWCNLIKF